MRRPLPRFTASGQRAVGVLVEQQRARPGRRRTSSTQCACSPLSSTGRPRRSPEPASSSCSTSSSTLPKRSKASAWATRSPPSVDAGPGHAAASSARRHEGLAALGQRGAGRDRAATGANRSRPWNVAARPARGGSGERPMSIASTTPPKRSAASCRRPLSGPTSSRSSSAVRSATARRSAPTSGSTTARWTPGGRVRQRAAQHQRARAHVVARDAVGQVDDPRLGGDARDDAVADADEVVVDAVVGQERDDRWHGLRRV